MNYRFNDELQITHENDIFISGYSDQILRSDSTFIQHYRESGTLYISFLLGLEIIFHVYLSIYPSFPFTIFLLVNYP